MIEVAGDIYWRRPRPTHGCRADDDDDGDVMSLKGSVYCCGNLKFRFRPGEEKRRAGNMKL